MRHGLEKMLGRDRSVGSVRSLSIGSTALLTTSLLLAACSQPAGYTEYGTPYGGVGTAPTYAPQQYYPPPGPPEDPWGPYIREASTRYVVPEQWVRAVMKQESGGEEQAVSPVGAMGLMQVMPATYAELRQRYALGNDPYNPHDNILAGTAYIREMYDRFGAPGFLAGYNAGPDRVEAYLAGAEDLPYETQHYLAKVMPHLGNVVAFSGPLENYTPTRSVVAARGSYPDAQSLAAGCDLDAAYDPNHPCTTLMRAATAPAPVQQAYLAQTGSGGCDLSAAYDPNRPCTSLGTTVGVTASSTPRPRPRPATVQLASADPEPIAVVPTRHSASLRSAAAGCGYERNYPCPPLRRPSPSVQLASAEGCGARAAADPESPCRAAIRAAANRVASPTSQHHSIAELTSLIGARPAAAEPYHRTAISGRTKAAPHELSVPDRHWGIQVGAFASPALARAVAEGARAQAPTQLHTAAIALPTVAARGAVLYRARLVNLSAPAATNACTLLNRRQLPCVVVQPSRS